MVVKVRFGDDVGGKGGCVGVHHLEIEQGVDEVGGEEEGRVERALRRKVKAGVEQIK